MIIGTGTDIVDTRRIEAVLARFGERFIRRCYTDDEIARAERRRPGGTHVATYAKRYAAKEAMAKALGTGIAKGVRFKDIGVINDDNGKPDIVLSGAAALRLAELLPTGHRAVIHLSLSDEPPIAKASVMIEALPA
jgi:holo-[acyl-carrier protein] synthase